MVKIKNYLYATSYDTCTITWNKNLIKIFVGTSSIIHFILLIHFRENIKKRKGKKKKKKKKPWSEKEADTSLWIENTLPDVWGWSPQNLGGTLIIIIFSIQGCLVE